MVAPFLNGIKSAKVGVFIIHRKRGDHSIKTSGHSENSNPSSSYYWKSYSGELRLYTEPVDKSVVYVPRN
jgi:hypothetical protein